LTHYRAESLQVVRRGRVRGKTTQIGWYSPRGDTCLFLGLEGVPVEDPSFSRYPVVIRASKLEEGDAILVECPFTLGKILPEYHQMLGSIVEHLKEAGEQGISTDDLSQMVDQDLRTPAAVPLDKVLRFATS
jgi:hypothetical protein